MKLFTTLLAISSTYRFATAFTTSTKPTVLTRTDTALFANPIVSRKRAFQDVVRTTVSTVALGTTFAYTTATQPANAVTFGGIDATPEESLRYVQRAIKAFEKLELAATNNEYQEIRNGIRSPALDTLRKYSGILISNGTGTEKDTLDASYKKFVSVFEKLDNQCGLAVRGKKNIQIYDLYTSSLKELKVFADTAEKVTGITPIE